MNNYLSQHGDGVGDIAFITNNMDKLQINMDNNAIITNDLQIFIFSLTLLLPIFIMNELRYGLCLSIITLALTKFDEETICSSINFLN